MKRKTRKKLTKFFLAAATLILTFSAVTVWANITYVKPQDVTVPVKIGDVSEIPEVVDFSSKSRAPEPATVALFGGGFFGMIMTFMRRTYYAAKRMFDITSALIGIVLTGPIMLITAVLVKLTSKGPIIYSQIRVGRAGKHFRIYKFRTMRVDAEKGTGPVWAQKNDNRITPIGQVLRKSRIDELPQFFNVLKGDMSLIGPRPERPTFVDQLKEQVPNYEGRLTVKPGITGLAQVRHRYDESIEDVKRKVRYDLFYIKNMNFWHDIGIVLRTFVVVLTGFGAR